MTGIERWLEDLGLGKYAPVFAEHEITLEVIADLTEADVDRLQLPTGPRRRLMVAIEARAAATRTELPGPAVATSEAPASTARGAERRQLTVMFCNFADSTSLSDTSDPEELRELMQACRRAASQVVERYEGHVAQYLGDGLMVYFGWPQAHEHDAERCLRAALEVVVAVKGVSIEEPLTVRIGVATGTVVVGDASDAGGAEAKLAVGETPNIAARLQALAAPDEVVIAPTTRRLLGDAFEVTDLGSRRLGGMSEPMAVWRVDALHRTEGRFEAAHEGLSLTPLVGRDEEVALLLRRWQQAREGEGQVVVVGGEPGIGKSRLTRVLRERIAKDPHTTIRYQCSPYHENSAMHPIIEQLEWAAGFTNEDTLEQRLDKLEAVLTGDEMRVAESAPLLAALLSLPTDRYAPLELSPQARKEKTLQVLADQVASLAEADPVLMVFEDAHWIDPSSQEAFDVLVPQLQDLPVLLVLTYRPEYTPRWGRQAHVTPLGLSRLGRREGAALVGEVTAGRALPAEVLEQIVAQTDGVPLFVEELTKSVLESGVLREVDGAYVLEGPLPALAIPTSLRDSLLARLDRLAPVKELIQIGACIGREFPHRLIVRVADGLGGSLEEGLRRLSDSEMVYRRGTPPHATYTFKHALMQDAAYDSLLKSRRVQMHARIAAVLEQDFTTRVANEPELLAHHRTESGDFASAIPLWQKAGELAVQRVALKEGVAHLRKGLALVEQLPPSTQRDHLELSVREPLNVALTGLRGWAAPEVAENGEALLVLAKSLGKTESLLLGLWGMWSNTITRGRIEASLEWAQRMLDEGDQAEDADLQIFGHHNVTISNYYLGHLLEAREQSAQVLALYDPARAGRWMQLTSVDLRTFMEVWSSQWTWMLGYPDRAVRVSEEKDAHARRLGSTFNLGFVLTLGAYVYDYRCEPDLLLERVDEAARLARDHSIPFLSRVQVPLTEGLARLRAGQLPEAIASLSQGIDNWNGVGGHIRIPYVKSALAEAMALQGDLNVALLMIDECLEQIERPGWQERSHLAEVLRLKGWMLMQQGRGEEAEAPLRGAIDWARQQQAKSWELRASTTLADLLIERGDRDAAQDLLGPIYNWFTEGLDTHDLVAARTLLKAPP